MLVTCSHGLSLLRVAQVQGEGERAENIRLPKDETPSYRDGFIRACLAVCGGDSQRTADMVLEDIP